MHSQSYSVGNVQPAYLNRHAISWRRVITVALGFILCGWITPGLVFGQARTVELSPLVAKSTFVTPLDRNQQISVALTLPLSDANGAAEFVQHVSQRGDPLFHKYLTPQEFANRFGANASDYAALKQWAAANGLTVSQESVARTVLTVRGTAAQFESIFNTQINNYRSPAGDEFYSAAVKPTIPAAISGKIAAVIGLTGSKMRTPHVKVGKVFGENPATVTANNTGDYSGTGPGGAYSASDLRTIYSIPTFGNLDKDTVVAVFEQGGFFKSDVEKYLDRMNLPHPAVTVVGVDGYDGTVDSYEIELEAVLDIDLVIGINPNVQEVLVYEDGIDTLPVALLDTLIQVGTDNKAQVLNISYGQDEGEQGTDAMNSENTALIQLAAQGITVTASSGDNGAYGDGYNYPYNVSDPASQPYVTGVGGTTLFTGPGEGYVSETVWNNSVFEVQASGGGISSYWPFPDFQGEMDPYFITYLGGSLDYRNVPDVAAVADPNTGVAIYSKYNGGWLSAGGTSASAPIWASFLSIVDVGMRYSGLGNIGWFNPILYNVGYWELPFVVKAANASKGSITTDGYGQPGNFLYPITSGTNGDLTMYPGYPGYSAGGTAFQPLYSNATGNGSLAGGLFATQILISGTQNGTQTGNITNFTVTAGSTTATFKWSPVSAALAYALTVGHDGDAYTVIDAYVTKHTSIVVKGLVPGDDTYSATLWAFNASGFSNYPITFKTKK